MDLLSNQLTLSSVEIKNQRAFQALQRLMDTDKVYQRNQIVRNNLGVSSWLNDEQKRDKQNRDTTSLTLQTLSSSILINPLSYVGYYNLFNYYARKSQITLAFPHLIQAISALMLEKAASINSLQIIAQVQKNFCGESVVACLVKALIHIKNQKHLLAIGDLSWVTQNTENLRMKIDVLELIGNIYALLRDQRNETKVVEQISRLKKYAQSIQSPSKQQITKLTCTILASSIQQEIKIELANKLKQFAQLLSSKQILSFKCTSQNNQLIFKQANMSSQFNLNSILKSIQKQIKQAPLPLKDSLEEIRQSKKSIEKSANQQEQKISNIVANQGSISAKDEKQQMSKSFQLEEKESTQNPKKKDISLVSPVKKKSLQIYPLQKRNQKVQIKIVMAQLTNNKELIGTFLYMQGSMDPYCVINYNKKKDKTNAIKAGGMQPKWRQSFTFILTEKPSELQVSVFDKETFFKKDDFVGSGKMLVQKNGFNKIPIFEAQKPAGLVFVSIQAKPQS